MTTNKQCNHVEAIAKDMFAIYERYQPDHSGGWDSLDGAQKAGWLNVAQLALPTIGKHALNDVKDYLTGQAKTSTGWKKWLYWAGIGIIGVILGGLGMSLSGCGHSVNVTPDRTEVCKDGSCIVIEPGHISYSQAQPETTVPPVVQVIPTK